MYKGTLFCVRIMKYNILKTLFNVYIFYMYTVLFCCSVKKKNESCYIHLISHSKLTDSHKRKNVSPIDTTCN